MFYIQEQAESVILPWIIIFLKVFYKLYKLFMFVF